MQNFTEAKQWEQSIFSPVSGYFSHVSDDAKHDYAMQAIEYTANFRGLNPVSASIVGSALRGNDHKASDVDVLVLVSNKIRARNLTFVACDGEEIDGKIESVDSFFAKLNTSVPYVEFALSPFRVTHSSYQHFLNSLAVYGWDDYSFAVHVQRFAEHISSRHDAMVARDDNSASEVRRLEVKRAQLLFALDYLRDNASATVPRYLFDSVADSIA